MISDTTLGYFILTLCTWRGLLNQIVARQQTKPAKCVRLHYVKVLFLSWDYLIPREEIVWLFSISNLSRQLGVIGNPMKYNKRNVVASQAIRSCEHAATVSLGYSMSGRGPTKSGYGSTRRPLIGQYITGTRHALGMNPCKF